MLPIFSVSKSNWWAAISLKKGCSLAFIQRVSLNYKTQRDTFFPKVSSLQDRHFSRFNYNGKFDNHVSLFWIPWQTKCWKRSMKDQQALQKCRNLESQTDKDSLEISSFFCKFSFKSDFYIICVQDEGQDKFQSLTYFWGGRPWAQCGVCVGSQYDGLVSFA